MIHLGLLRFFVSSLRLHSRASCFVVCASLFVLRGLCFVLLSLWFVVGGSLFVVGGSWFTLRGWWLVVRFVVCGSCFVFVLHSGFVVRYLGPPKKVSKKKKVELKSFICNIVVTR